MQYNLLELHVFGCHSISDFSILKLSNRCPKLQCLDLLFCRNISSISMFSLIDRYLYLKSLSLKNNDYINDITAEMISEKCHNLESLFSTYCISVSDESIIYLVMCQFKKVGHKVSRNTDDGKNLNYINNIRKMGGHPDKELL